jgi:hypothetical protein
MRWLIDWDDNESNELAAPLLGAARAILDGQHTLPGAFRSLLELLFPQRVVSGGSSIVARFP